MRIGRWLTEAGVISGERLERALSECPAGMRLGEYLVREGLATESQVLDALAAQVGLPRLDDPSDDHLDGELVRELPVEWARRERLLPIRWKEGVGALCADPSSVDALNRLEWLLGTPVQPVLCAGEPLLAAIDRCYFERTSGTRDLIRSLEEDSGAEEDRGSEDLLESSDAAPAARLVNSILLDAVRVGASDIHIEPFQSEFAVRFRIDGVLYRQDSPPRSLQLPMISRLKVMARLDIAERRLPQDGTAQVRVGDRDVDIRVSTIPVAEGERVVLRLLHRETAMLPLEDLGLRADLLTRFRGLLREPQGMILVTGPTGSGKTTTLYAALQEMDTAGANVLTIEDPIEYQLEGIGQIQVRPRIGLTFSRGLRHILRQDPDTILVGETRDLETAEIAVRAAMTGHLVFTTLHTNDAASAPLRLADMGVPPYLLSDALRGVLSQRLVRRLCPACRAPDDGAAGRAWKAVGCPACTGGYRGRCGLFELLEIRGPLVDAVRGQAGVQVLREAANALGQERIEEDAARRIADGVTSREEVVRVLGRARLDGIA
jgi:general secretion pathway protein E